MKDNKPRVNVQLIIPLKPGFAQIRSLELLSPALTNYALESEITNGLGYMPVRKSMQESKVHSQEGLQAHLANMDYTVLWRQKERTLEVGRQHAIAMVQLEDLYKNMQEIAKQNCELFMNESMNHMRHHGNEYCMEDNKLKFAEFFGIDTSKYKSIKDEPASTQAQEARPWYKRIFG